MKAFELAEALDWTLLTGDGQRQVEGCYIGDMLSRVMTSCGEGDLWITVQTSLNMLAVAEFADAACVVLPEGIRLDDKIAGRAREQEITVFASNKSAFELALEISSLLRPTEDE